ncbi:MAG: hypothetical protein JO297_16390 [Nitrososphaeraceae archaeon]|nr:hypothetical protein [Nitrososphaeraceae archaeon]
MTSNIIKKCKIFNVNITQQSKVDCKTVFVIVISEILLSLVAFACAFISIGQNDATNTTTSP